MNLAETWDFLRPHSGDAIQWGFFLILTVMLIVPALVTWLWARSGRWERNWNRGAPGDDAWKLEIEHGSVTDLSNAVATAPEKLFDVMPSLMLVVGLLGTFLGLGLALNHASNILGKPDAMSAAGAARSMNDLVGLLQGLGTKFKTSTWGVIGFIILRLVSELMRHDERRLQWVVRKVQEQLLARRDAQAGERAARRQEQFDKIEHVGGLMARAFSDSLAESFAGHGKLIQGLQREHGLKLDDQNKALLGSIERLGADLGSAIDGLAKDSTATQRAIVDFSRRTGEMLEGLERGAKQVAASSTELNKAVAKLQSGLETVLNDVRDGLKTAIETLGDEAARALTLGSDELKKSSGRIEAVLKSQSDKLEHTMTGVQQSLVDSKSQQAKATASLGTLTLTLSENVHASTEQFGKLGRDVQSSLKSVSTVGEHIRDAVRHLEEFPQTVVSALMAVQPEEPPFDLIAARLELLEALDQLPKHLKAIEALPVQIALALRQSADGHGGDAGQSSRMLPRPK